MTRIRSTNVKFGDSFVLPIEKEKEEIPESPELIKLKEDLRLLNLEVEKAKERKETILQEAQAQAENLVQEQNNKIAQENEQIAQQREAEKNAFDEQMAQEAEKIRAEAYQTGYDDGYKQGYVVITNELENKIHAVDDFAKCQFDLKSNIIKSSELDIINLVVEIAKKVCTKSVELNPEILKALTENAIKELKDKEDITIIINPKLLEAINSVSDKLKEDIPQLQNIKIIEDNAVSADGTIVESPLTRVDSRVKSQINEIAEKLFEAYNSEDEAFDNFILSMEEPDVEDIEHIELSDDANIAEFLSELEDIPSYDDKLRDEDADYYEHLDLDELKSDDIENSLPETAEEKINEINLDDYENLDEVLSEPETISIVDETQNIDDFISASQQEQELQDVQLLETPQEQLVENEIQSQSQVEEVIPDNPQPQDVLVDAPEQEKSEDLLQEDIQIYDENLKQEEIQSEIPQKDEKIIEKSLEQVEKVEKEIETDVKPFEFAHLDEGFDISDDISDEIDIKSKLDKLTPVDDNKLIGEDDVQ